MSKYIYWTGQTTDKVITYKAQGETYKELFENINEKYGYDTIINQDLVDEKISQSKDLTDEDYKEMIVESTGQAYYHEFEIEESHIATYSENDNVGYVGNIEYDSFESLRDDISNDLADVLDNEQIVEIDHSENMEELQDWLDEFDVYFIKVKKGE